MSAYLGKWYELYHTRGMPFQSDDGTDTTATYSANPNGTVNVLNQQWSPQENRWIIATALATPIDDPAHLSVQFPNVPFPGDYRVLSTDYTNCAVVYSQQTFRGQTIKYAWILGRQTFITDSVAAAAFALLRQVGDLSPTQFLRDVHGV